MTAKTVDVELPKLIPAIKQIADSRPNIKGIVHAVSYKLAHQIVDLIKDPRFVTHNSDDRQDVLTNFINSTGNQILVSPSLERGVSLEEDKCRLIIIAKHPFLSLGDRIVSTRLYAKGLGQSWYTANSILTVIQMCGRAVRSKNDYAETFILDFQTKQAITKYPSFAPVWWLDAISFELPNNLRDKI
jgi:Rad3-related DNA helicase